MAAIFVQKELSQFVRAAGAFDRAARKQVPFAISLSINSALFDARREIVGVTFPRSFEIRNGRFPSAAMRVDKAHKGNLQGSLYDRLGRGHLQKHALSGTKQAASGNLAIPAPHIAKLRGARGIPKSKRPRAFKNKKTIRVTDEGIFEGRGGRLHALYFFERTARLPKRFPFYETFEREVETSMRRTFPANFRKALASAK